MADGVLLGQTWLAADGLTVVDTLSFSYTSDGLLLSASNGFGAYTFTWDDGQLLGVTNPFGVTLTFGYDGDGRRTSVADFVANRPRLRKCTGRKTANHKLRDSESNSTGRSQINRNKSQKNITTTT
ncbi:MAG: RHS repeat domain-containing protein [Gemmataceae bacterium]